jgi:3-dehydroquinate dehydratase-1
MLQKLVETARVHATRVLLSFHDFQDTPSNESLLDRISEMVTRGADIAKIACMPRKPGDVLRLLQITHYARQAYPAVPLCTISMGRAGALSRVAAFLYGCDMTFAVSQEASAPGQIPIAEARMLAETLLRYSED